MSIRKLAATALLGVAAQSGYWRLWPLRQQPRLVLACRVADAGIPVACRVGAEVVAALVAITGLP